MKYGPEMIVLFMLIIISWRNIHLHCFRTDGLKQGELIGEDQFGNKYYRNDEYFMGKRY